MVVVSNARYALRDTNLSRQSGILGTKFWKAHQNLSPEDKFQLASPSFSSSVEKNAASCVTDTLTHDVMSYKNRAYARQLR